VTLMLFVSMSIALPMCPNCQSDAVMKNDRTRLSCRAFKLHIRGGRDAHPTRVLLFFDIQFKCRNSLRAQNYKCRDCGRQFVEDPQWRMISEETKGIIDRLLLEKLSLAGIARALEISEMWVQQ